VIPERTTMHRLILILAFFTLINAQFLGQNRNSGVGIPYFEFRAFTQYKDSSATILVASEILYDDLSFIRETESYTAKYELAIYLQNEEQDETFGYIPRTFEVETDHFAATNSRERKDKRSFQFSTKPGTYKLTSVVTDLNSDKKVKRDVELDIRDVADTQILVSDILFYEHNPANGEKLLSLTNNFSRDQSKVEILFKVASVKNAPINIRIEYLDAKENLISTLLDSMYSGTRYIELEQNFDLKQSKASYNKIKIVATQDDQVSESTRDITFFWSEKPQTELDIDVALRQMKYIANTDSIETYLESKNTEDKIGYFDRYWQSIDPTPNTERNELKEEFFQRINTTNKYFSFFSTAGWLTDRGRIYILFGQPDEIDRHPFDMGSKPWEMWYYHSLKKRFRFYDDSGMGDYRLDPNYFVYEYN
jgi:GWxTD domain-containing protein